MTTQQATCRFFSTIQGCRNGSDCNFSHTEQIQQKQPQQRIEQQCPLLQRSQPRSQPRFQQRQERKPTVLCKFFPNCHKGSLCTFLHPQEKQEKQEPQEKQEQQEPQEQQEKQEKIIVSTPPSAKGTNKLIRYCYFFNSPKGCRNGDTCDFAHQEYQD